MFRIDALEASTDLRAKCLKRNVEIIDCVIRLKMYILHHVCL